MIRQSLSATIIIVCGLLLVGTSTMMPAQQACAAQPALSYADDIVPVFKGWCVSCHQPGGQGYEASGVDLTSYAGLMKGTKFGPVVIPGQPDTSSLIALIYGRTSSKIRMPFGHKPLPGCVLNNIWTWIFEGAKDN
jgi:hypothetical protein